MSTVEAAASLFGSDGDSGPDPFAVIGNEAMDTTPPAGLTSYEYGQHDSASYPSHMGQDASSLFAGDQSAEHSQQDPWSVPTNQEPGPLDNSQYSNHSATGYEASDGRYPGPSYSSTSQPQAPYAQQPAPASCTGPTSVYDHHKPEYMPASNPSSSQYSGNQYPYAPVHGGYDPYPPTTNIAPNCVPQPPPAAPANIQGGYGSYNHMTRSVSQPHVLPAYPATPKHSLPSIPPPPAEVPPAESFRPKKLNAYDPPLPPLKVSKRTVSARTPALGQYPLYGQPSPVPPVPSLPPSNTTGDRYGSLSSSVAHPSGSSPPPRVQASCQLTIPLNITPASDPQQSLLAQPPAIGHYAQSGLSHAVAHPSPLAAPPRRANAPTPPQKPYTQEMVDDTPTPRQGPPSLFSGHHIQRVASPDVNSSYQLPTRDEHLESRAYTSTDMPWDDPEGLPVETTSFDAVQTPYSPPPPETSGVSERRPEALLSTSPAPVLPTEHVDFSDLIHPPSSPPSSHSSKGGQPQGTWSRGSASSRSASHSRDGSNGSNVSSIRSPVQRVSSPLRNAIDSSGQDVHPGPPRSVHKHPFEPSHYTVPNRVASPGSVHSFTSHAGSVKSVHNSTATPVTNNHEPKSHATYERASSPAVRRVSPVPNPYAPAKNAPVVSPDYRGRSGSSTSLHSSASLPVGIPPQREVNGFHPKPRLGESSSYGAVSAYSQELQMSPATRPPYAPSPSLLGTNDPLGRTSTRAPVISFGFSGKMVTCFHSSPDLITGFDVALSSRHSTDVRIRVLHKTLPEFALEPSAAVYPGPLFSDTPVSLVRTGSSSQMKTKKGRVIQYLEQRIEELSRGVMYMSEGTDKQHAEGKLVLVKLLKIMVENDGVLSGSAHIDSAVRAALLPRISISEGADNGSGALSTPGFASPMSNAYGRTPGSYIGHPGSNETPISVSTLFPSALDKIQEFLVRGERRQAYHYALDEKLWAHAMVIASSIDKEAWKEVVNEFVKTELGVRDVQRTTLVGHGKDQVPSSNGREWLRVVYGLFSGQGPTAVQELIPNNLLAKATGALQIPAPAGVHPTPMSPNFPSAAMAAQVPADALSKWPELVAAIVSSPLSPEWSATLTALGDYLVSHQQVAAAHACYLLSPQTSPIGGVGSPSTRVVLVGSRSPHSWPAFLKDPDSVILSEVVEFALSLKSTPKGQEPFHGLPHLQAYKLIRASYLAEIGEIQAASRYCEAITAAMTHSSPYFNFVVVEQLKGLADRLTGVPQAAKNASWMGNKVNKPSLDGIGSWLEGRLTKFIAGEGDDSSPQPEPSKSQVSSLGPFSHFSEISSATTSASPSPPPGIMNLHSSSATPPPRRSGSAMAVSTSHAHVPIDRASSAMEYYHPTRRESPALPKTAPLHPPRSYPYSAHGAGVNGHSPMNGYVPAYPSEPISRKPSLEMTAEESPEQQQESGWWSSLSNSDAGPTPTTTTFHQVDNLQASPDGFISLMDAPVLDVAPTSSVLNHQPQHTFEDEEDDLGFGNHAFKRKRPQEASEYGSNEKPSALADDAKEEKQDTKPSPTAPASSGSWLGRAFFWKKSEASPGPIKANLGEQSSYYYDKDLKRWVNKKAGAEITQPAAPPPPPSRAQTASPAHASAPPLHANGTNSAPPARPTSAIDLSASPNAKPPPRVRSSLAPPEATSLPNTPTSGSMTPPSPMSRPRSQAAKRNVRTRYVDVLQQQEAAS